VGRLYFTPRRLFGVPLGNNASKEGNDASIAVVAGATLGNGAAIFGSGSTIFGNGGVISRNGRAIPTLCGARVAFTLCATPPFLSSRLPNQNRGQSFFVASLSF